MNTIKASRIVRYQWKLLEIPALSHVNKAVMYKLVFFSLFNINLDIAMAFEKT